MYLIALKLIKILFYFTEYLNYIFLCHRLPRKKSRTRVSG